MQTFAYLTSLNITVMSSRLTPGEMLTENSYLHWDVRKNI